MPKIKVKSGVYKIQMQIKQFASEYGMANAIEFFDLNKEEKITAWKNDFFTDQYGWSDLHRAVAQGDIKKMELVLALAPEMYIIGVNDTEITVLDLAIKTKNIKVIEFLMEKAPYLLNIEKSNTPEYSALKSAVALYGDEHEVVKFISHHTNEDPTPYQLESEKTALSNSQFPKELGNIVADFLTPQIPTYDKSDSNTESLLGEEKDENDQTE